MFIKLIFFLLLNLLVSAYSAGQVCRIDASMTSDDFKTLFTRRLFKKDFLPATINVDGTKYEDCKIKFKGSTSPLFPKKPFRVKIGKHSQIPQVFNGMHKMNLNAMYTDKSFIRERLVWDIFQMMDGFGPKQYGYAELSLNGCYNGLYLLLQHIDEEFLKENGKPEGSIYEAEEEATSGNLRPIADGLMEKTYEKHVGDEKDYSDLKQLINTLNNTNDADIANVLNGLFDMKTVYDWFVLNVITMQGDSYVKNYFLYRDPSKSTQQWSIIPWDFDLSFGRDGDDKIPYPNSMLNDLFAYDYEPLAGPDNLLKEKVLKDPVLSGEFKKRLYDVLQNVFTEEKLFPHIDKYSAEAEPFVRKETLMWGSPDEFKDQVNAIKYFITARRNLVLSFYGFISSPENDEASLNVTQTDVPYNFVDHEGKLIAQMTFSSISSPMTVRVKAYPNTIPAEMNSSQCIHRLLEIETNPPTAGFNAVLKWEYLHANDFNEVGDGAASGNQMRCYNLINGLWQKLDSYVNGFGDYVTVTNVNESNCGEGRFFSISLPGGFSQVFIMDKNLFWNCWHDINFVNAQTGYIAGDDGTILVTNDAGNTWKLVFTGNHSALFTVASNGNTVFAGGMYGILLRSTTGGSGWETLKSNTTNTINKIEFRGSNGWAVCNGGYVIRTQNSGGSWSLKSLGDGKDIHTVCSIDDQNVVLGGEDGTLLISSNSGDSWSSLNSGTTNCIKAIYADGSNLSAVCDGGIILTSSNSGKSWVSVNSGTTDNLLGVCKTQQGWLAGGENGILLQSSNGKDWSRLDNYYPNNITSLKNIGNSDILAVGNFGAILRTR